MIVITTVVIVESPTKAKSIQKYLGNDYIVKASMGHIRDLPQKELGIDLNTFSPLYEITKPKVVAELKSIVKGNDVLLASDPDREDILT